MARNFDDESVHVGCSIPERAIELGTAVVGLTSMILAVAVNAFETRRGPAQPIAPSDPEGE